MIVRDSNGCFISGGSWNKGKKGYATKWKGGHQSNITKKKISRALKGRKFSVEHRQKIADSLKKITKKPLSNSIKQKISNSLKGKKFSNERKENIRKSLLGRSLSRQHKENIGRSLQGEKSSFWKGGISFEPYSIDWTRTLKRSIRERDKYTCQVCGALQGDKAFCVHHIDYDKKNCNPDNLITLCRKCHTKTNNNRDYWINYMKKIRRLKDLEAKNKIKQ